jgi:hypothetical protein
LARGCFGDGKLSFEGSAATKWSHRTSLFCEAKPIFCDAKPIARQRGLRAGGSRPRHGKHEGFVDGEGWLGRYVVELNESAAIIVEQIEDEITVVIASVVGVNFQVTAAQALELYRALAAAAASVTPSTAS